MIAFFVIIGFCLLSLAFMMICFGWSFYIEAKHDMEEYRHDKRR